MVSPYITSTSLITSHSHTIYELTTLPLPPGLNTICLSLDQFPNLPRQQVEVITLLNNIFTVIFIGELIITNIAIGIIKYWTNITTAFDGVIVTFSIIEIIIAWQSDDEEGGGGAFS